MLQTFDEWMDGHLSSSAYLGPSAAEQRSPDLSLSGHLNQLVWTPRRSQASQEI